MSIKDYLFTTTSAFILLIVFILFISGFIIYYIQTRLKEQNHKLDSMFSLVSTMAQQLNTINHIPGDSCLKSDPLICVSDDESTFTDDNADNNSESSSSSSGSESDYESDTDDDNDDEVVKEGGNSYNKIITIPEFEQLYDNVEVSCDIDDDSDTSSENDNLEVNDINDIDENNDINEIDTNTAWENLTDTNDENIKHVIIDDIPSSSNLEEDTRTIDYKKMTITKLKSIAQGKGLINDSSKLKKNELLKLLSQE